jgi:hypothetical protein
MLQLQAQLNQTEDQLARLQAEYEEALLKASHECCRWKERCAMLEAQQNAEIQACATTHSISTDIPEVRKAFLVGKAEGQRELVAAQKQNDLLTRALSTADQNSLSANVQLLELKVRCRPSSVKNLPCHDQ